MSAAPPPPRRREILSAWLWRAGAGDGEGAQGIGRRAGEGCRVIADTPKAAALGVNALSLDELVQEGFAPGDRAGGVEEDGFVADPVEGQGEGGVGVEGVGQIGGDVAFEERKERGNVFGGLEDLPAPVIGGIGEGFGDGVGFEPAVGAMDGGVGFVEDRAGRRSAGRRRGQR